jgi:rod shape-determining protein MreB
MAGDAIDALLEKAIRERYPDASISSFMVREWKEQHSFVGKPRDRVQVTAPVAGKPTQLDITAEMRAACEALVAPVAETVQDLLARVEPEFQDRVRRNILLSGCGSLMRGLKEALEGELENLGGAEVSRVKDPVFIGAEGGLAIAQDAADSDWEKIAG